MSVNIQKEEALKKRLAELAIREEDLRENFIRGSGHGGQKINKTSSCVQLLHVPTGIEVRCQRERSQALNRFLARRELCDRIAEKVFREKSQRQQEREKIRRQKRRRSRRQKEKMLQQKHHHAEKKQWRRGVTDND